MHSRTFALLCASIAMIVAPAATGAEPFLLGPPDGNGPVKVLVGFFLSE